LTGFHACKGIKSLSGTDHDPGKEEKDILFLGGKLAVLGFAEQNGVMVRRPKEVTIQVSYLYYVVLGGKGREGIFFGRIDGD